MPAQKETLSVDVYKTVSDVVTYVESKPIRATLEVKLRPEFTFQNNLRDIILQIVMQFCLMGKTEAIEKIRDAAFSNEAPEKVLSALFKLFDDVANDITDSPENAEKIAALKKLKKLIHAYADLIDPDFRLQNRERIVNVKKAELKNNAVYVVRKNIPPITTEENRQKRKTAKSRLNRSSLFVSVIVGIGEGMIAAAFAAAAMPFLPALLAVGIPAILCNYFLFRGASFSVMKQIYFGKSTDDKKTKILKGASTFFSAMAGLTYGFLSYGSASIAFGKLFFGLTAAAAMAAPPVALIAIALVISVVTAIAVTTLYDHALRGIIDKGIKKSLLELKESFINFFKPENNKLFRELTLTEKLKHIAKKTLQGIVHFVFYSVAVAISAVVILAIMPIMRHKATSILHGTFRLAHKTAEVVSKAITIGMGSLVNGFFYVKQVIGAMNIVKKVAHAIWYPRDAAQKMKKEFDDATANSHIWVQTVVTSVKRLFLFGTVVANSVVGQGVGASHSHAAQKAVSAIVPDNSESVSSAAIAVGISVASATANGKGVHGATGGVGFFSKPKEKPQIPDDRPQIACAP